METVIYTFGGLLIASEFPLCGLQVCPNESEVSCDVVIRHAAIPKEIDSTVARFIDGYYSGTYNGKDVLIESSARGRFLLRGGKEIIIDLAPSSNPDDVRAYLRGPLLGGLFHQRGIAPLHASAVELAGRCFAFVGASRAGKSTLAAALAQRGHEVVADDECFIKQGSTGEVQAWFGTRCLRLWEDTRAFLGFDGLMDAQEMRSHSKQAFPVRAARDPRDLRRLRGVYQLYRNSDGTADVTRLHGADAVEALLQNIYLRNFAVPLGYDSNVFRVCAAVARDVPVFRFSRPHDFAAIDEVTDQLEAHLREMS